MPTTLTPQSRVQILRGHFAGQLGTVVSVDDTVSQMGRTTLVYVDVDESSTFSFLAAALEEIDPVFSVASVTTPPRVRRDRAPFVSEGLRAQGVA